MRVALDLLHLSASSGGTGTYARRLIPALAEVDPGLDLVLHVGSAAPEWVAELPGERVRWRAQVAAPTLGGAARLLATQWFALAQHARRTSVDVLHGLANVVPPVSPGTHTVATIHDVIWRRHRRTMDLRGTIGFEVVTRVAARRADHVLTPSAAAAGAVTAALRVPRDRVTVTPLAPDRVQGPATAEHELRRSLGLGDQPVILAVAQKRPHKNLVTLVRALPSVDGVMVVPGAPTAHEADLHAEAQRLGVPDRLVTPPWVSDEELRGLRRMAAVAVLPSHEEGFGLPVLEAMAAGVPVVCSDTPALVEVTGGAALVAAADDPAAFAAAVRAAMADPEPLRLAGLRRAAEFSWLATARATHDVYRRLVER